MLAWRAHRGRALFTSRTAARPSRRAPPLARAGAYAWPPVGAGCAVEAPERALLAAWAVQPFPLRNVVDVHLSAGAAVIRDVHLAAVGTHRYILRTVSATAGAD